MTTTTETPERAAAAAPAAAGDWTARRFFAALRALSPLRVISPSGPSLFEAICTLGPFGIADGHLNAITPEYHWHLRLDGLQRVRSRDDVHARSGRRVLFFELYEAEASEPFLWIYLHRPKGEEFGAEREAAFAELHAAFAEGRALEAEP